MWSYVCVFLNLYLARFEPFARSIYGHATTLRPLPAHWKGLVKAEEHLYDQDRKADTEGTFNRYIDKFVPNASPAEKAHVISIVLKVLRYCPEDRLTATQLLQDPSFKALMEMYCT